MASLFNCEICDKEYDEAYFLDECYGCYKMFCHENCQEESILAIIEYGQEFCSFQCYEDYVQRKCSHKKQACAYCGAYSCAEECFGPELCPMEPVIANGKIPSTSVKFLCKDCYIHADK